jgi:hypothetical protein
MGGCWRSREQRAVADDHGFVCRPSARLGHNLASFASPISPEGQLGHVFHPVVAGVAYVKRHKAKRLIIASQMRSPN